MGSELKCNDAQHALDSMKWHLHARKVGKLIDKCRRFPFDLQRSALENGSKLKRDGVCLHNPFILLALWGDTKKKSHA